MSELTHTEEKLWIEIDGNIATIGIEKEKADELGSVSSIELPDAGKEVNKGDEVVTIETAKSVEKIKSPLSGKIVDVNETLKDNPEKLTEDPTGEGYLFKIMTKS